MAYFTSPATSWMSSFFMSRARWFSTVFGFSPSNSAISRPVRRFRDAATAISAGREHHFAPGRSRLEPVELAELAEGREKLVVLLNFPNNPTGYMQTPTEGNALAAALEAEGYSVWWDRHLTGGSEFARDIERELNAAGVVLVAWSDAARESPWVKDEAAVGQEAGKLVAMALDDGPPPLGFRQFHATDLSGWTGDPASADFRALVAAIEASL